jgi:hypothetical protein
MTEIILHTIYKHPKDYPTKFVVRKFIAKAGKIIPDNNAQTADTLEEIRKLVPLGLQRVPRNKTDDPVIVETWV